MPTATHTESKGTTRTRAISLVREARAAKPAGSPRAEALLALIARRRQRIVEDFYDIGEALAELWHQNLHLKLGFATFDDMLEARKVVSRAQAYKLMAVVSAYSRERALQLGLEKSFAVITYAAATPSHMVPELVALTGIGGHGIESMTTREIATATKRLRARTGTARGVSPAMKHARDIAAGWKKRLSALGVGPIDVTVHQVHGEFVVDARVPVGVLERLGGRKAAKRVSDR